MRQTRHAVIIGATVLTAGALAYAQTGQDPAYKPNQNQPQQQKHTKSGQTQLKRVSEINGCNVTDQAGKEIGEIETLAVDINDGITAFALLTLSDDAAGAGADQGDKLYPVPFQNLKFQGETCQLKFDRTKLQTAPSISDDQFAQLSDQTMLTRIHQHYGVQPYWQSSGSIDAPRPGVSPPASPPGSDRPGGMDRPGEPGAKPMAGTRALVKGDDLIGAKVENMRNDNLGEIEDLMVDVNNGRLAYCVVSRGGFLGVGEDLQAVPFKALTIRSTRNELNAIVLNIDEARFKEAPTFSRREWPQMDSAEWGREIHVFYGTDQDWVYGFSPADRPDREMQPPGQIRPGATAQPTEIAWTENQQYLRLFNAQNLETKRCRVQSVQQFTPQGLSPGVMLVCQPEGATAQGGAMNVHLGPAWYIDRQPRQFKAGDSLTIECCPAQFEGKAVFIAKEITVNGQTMMLRHDDGQPMWKAWKDGSTGSQPIGTQPGTRPENVSPGTPRPGTTPERPGTTTPR